MQALEYPDFTREDLTDALNSSQTEAAFLEDHADMVAFFDNEYPRLQRWDDEERRLTQEKARRESETQRKNEIRSRINKN